MQRVIDKAVCLIKGRTLEDRVKIVLCEDTGSMVDTTEVTLFTVVIITVCHIAHPITTATTTVEKD